jgi:hypothetical protein
MYVKPGNFGRCPDLAGVRLCAKRQPQQGGNGCGWSATQPRASQIRTLLIFCALTILVFLTTTARALDGMIGIRNPSTVITCDGGYYDYGTGRGISVLTYTKNPSRVQTARYLVHDDQKGNLTPAGGGGYKIINASGDKALAARDGTVDTAAFTGDDAQRWVITAP